MTVIFNWEMRREGLFVTSLKTNEDRLEIPSELSGEPVVGLGGRFLLGYRPRSDSRIPMR